MRNELAEALTSSSLEDESYFARMTMDEVGADIEEHGHVEVTAENVTQNPFTAQGSLANALDEAIEETDSAMHTPDLSDAPHDVGEVSGDIEGIEDGTKMGEDSIAHHVKDSLAYALDAIVQDAEAEVAEVEEEPAEETETVVEEEEEEEQPDENGLVYVTATFTVDPDKYISNNYRPAAPQMGTVKTAKDIVKGGQDKLKDFGTPESKRSAQEADEPSPTEEKAAAQEANKEQKEVEEADKISQDEKAVLDYATFIDGSSFMCFDEVDAIDYTKITMDAGPKKKVTRDNCQTTFAQCRAKNPLFCRFHGPKLLEADIKQAVRATVGGGCIVSVTKDKAAKNKFTFRLTVGCPPSKKKMVEKIVHMFMTQNPGISSSEEWTDLGKGKETQEFEMDILRADEPPTKKDTKGQASVFAVKAAKAKNKVMPTVPDTPAGIEKQVGNPPPAELSEEENEKQLEAEEPTPDVPPEEPAPEEIPPKRAKPKKVEPIEESKVEEPSPASMPEAEEAKAEEPVSNPTLAAIENIAKAFAARDTKAGNAAMNALREAKENGIPFPSEEEVSKIANEMVPEDMRSAFNDNMKQWRDHFEASDEEEEETPPPQEENAKGKGEKPNALEDPEFYEAWEEAEKPMLQDEFNEAMEALPEGIDSKSVNIIKADFADAIENYNGARAKEAIKALKAKAKQAAPKESPKKEDAKAEKPAPVSPSKEETSQRPTEEVAPSPKDKEEEGKAESPKHGGVVKFPRMVIAEAKGPKVMLKALEEAAQASRQAGPVSPDEYMRKVTPRSQPGHQPPAWVDSVHPTRAYWMAVDAAIKNRHADENVLKTLIGEGKSISTLDAIEQQLNMGGYLNVSNDRVRELLNAPFNKKKSSSSTDARENETTPAPPAKSKEMTGIEESSKAVMSEYSKLGNEAKIRPGVAKSIKNLKEAKEEAESADAAYQEMKAQFDKVESSKKTTKNGKNLTQELIDDALSRLNEARTESLEKYQSAVDVLSNHIDGCHKSLLSKEKSEAASSVEESIDSVNEILYEGDEPDKSVSSEEYIASKRDELPEIPKGKEWDDFQGEMMEALGEAQERAQTTCREFEDAVKQFGMDTEAGQKWEDRKDMKKMANDIKAKGAAFSTAYTDYKDTLEVVQMKIDEFNKIQKEKELQKPLSNGPYKDNPAPYTNFDFPVEKKIEQYYKNTRFDIDKMKESNARMVELINADSESKDVNKRHDAIKTLVDFVARLNSGQINNINYIVNDYKKDNLKINLVDMSDSVKKEVARAADSYLSHYNYAAKLDVNGNILVSKKKSQ